MPLPGHFILQHASNRPISMRTPGRIRPSMDSIIHALPGRAVA
jgi:hypothetical protein